MKIVSLQSVGLGDTGPGVDGLVFTKPIYYEVGEGVVKLSYLMTGDEPKVTKIEFGDMYHGIELPKQDGTYFVHTSDGHIRVLPADKYIAEWSE